MSLADNQDIQLTNIRILEYFITQSKDLWLLVCICGAYGSGEDVNVTVRETRVVHINAVQLRHGNILYTRSIGIMANN